MVYAFLLSLLTIQNPARLKKAIRGDEQGRLLGCGGGYLAALRLAALWSTTALELAPGTNLGTVVAGILSVAPVGGLLPVRAARLTDLKAPKPIS